MCVIGSFQATEIARGLYETKSNQRFSVETLVRGASNALLSLKSADNLLIMHIMLVVQSLRFGGAERVASTLVNGWAEEGEQVTVLTLDDATQDFYSLDPRVRRVTLDLSCKSPDWRKFIWNNIRRVRALRAGVRSCDPDVVVSFMEKTNVLVLLATRGLSVPVVVEEHTDPRMHSVGGIAGWLRRLVYPRACAVVVLTPSVIDWAREIAGSTPVHVIPNPISHQFLGGEEIDKTRNRHTVVGMGRMEPEKGFDMLLRAFAQCAARHPDWSLRIVGQGSERQRLTALVDELRLGDQVSLDPVVKEPERVLRGSDLFVLSSRYEGFPMVLLEAMASGLPVVSFDCPSGPREMIREGIDGVLVPPNDVGALAGALDRLMGAQDERQQLGRRAVEVIQRFGLPTILAMWNEVLMKAVSRNVSASASA
jgi:GalNAc-alpha-(1->4)-GalNAc-alpha-(1->3)-diNAcBac-PP-undecaprenol alpha-1,4-N-acetyl-D-galactosaminyltransferase